MLSAAAWYTFHLNNVVIVSVSSEVLKRRLLKLLLDHPIWPREHMVGVNMVLA